MTMFQVVSKLATESNQERIRREAISALEKEIAESLARNMEPPTSGRTWNVEESGK